jgi:hypothetical protein
MQRYAVMALLGATVLGAAWALAAGAAADTGAAVAKLDMQPASLTIGTFYAGQPVKLSGEIAQGQEVILEMRGPGENISFDLKGQVGPFWMNRGLVRVENAPTLYILLLSSGAPAEPELAALGLGLSQLKQETKVSAHGQDPDQLFARFLEFKREAGLYQQRTGAVTYAPAGPNRQSFAAVMDFPSSLAAGQYQVTATVLENGAPLGRLSKAYAVEDGPFLGLVKGLAFDRALLFGVLCVLVALVTGAVMGLLFKGGKGGH